jgi:hypothetical protein
MAKRYCYGHTTGEVRRHLVRSVITCTNCKLAVATSRQIAIYIAKLQAKARQRFSRSYYPGYDPKRRTYKGVKIYRTRPYNSRKAPSRRVKRSPAGKLKRRSK